LSNRAAHRVTTDDRPLYPQRVQQRHDIPRVFPNGLPSRSIRPAVTGQVWRQDRDTGQASQLRRPVEMAAPGPVDQEQGRPAPS
jgi:hypothetical protein